MVLCSFLPQLFHSSIPKLGLTWPHRVYFLGEPGSVDDLNELLDEELPKDIRKRVRICNKNPLSRLGLEKAKIKYASMIYVLPSLGVEDMDEEDHHNIQIALSVKGTTDKAFR